MSKEWRSSEFPPGLQQEEGPRRSSREGIDSDIAVRGLHEHCGTIDIYQWRLEIGRRRGT